MTQWIHRESGKIEAENEIHWIHSFVQFSAATEFRISLGVLTFLVSKFMPVLEMICLRNIDNILSSYGKKVLIQ